MLRIKKREQCMACLSELGTQGKSAARARPATIKVKMDSGVRFFLCEEHFKSYCRVMIDEDRQSAILH
jgi:hypothetical protein